MKKILMFTAAAFVLTMPMAFAEEAAKAEKTTVQTETKEPTKRSGMFEKLDSDGDGTISKAEYLSVHEKRFSEMDANGDGKISQEEGEARQKEWRIKMEEMRAKRKEEKAAKDAAVKDVPVKEETSKETAPVTEDKTAE